MNSTLSIIAPITQKKTASERVGDRLRELISSGNIAPGEKLPSENDLAQALQVSRPVVREALRGLAMMGIVEARQGGGRYVTDLKANKLMEPLAFYLELEKHSLDELFDSRVLIDGSLAGDAAKRASTSQKERLSNLVKLGHTLTTDPIRFRVMDAELHGLISEAGANAFLNRVSQSLYSLAINRRRKASELPNVLVQSAKDHEEIVKHIITGDSDKAQKAMIDHVENIRKTTALITKATE